MKTTTFLTCLFMCFYLLSSSQNNTIAHKVAFGIYETVDVSKLPHSFIQTFKRTNLTLEQNKNVPIIGYFEDNDAAMFKIDLSKENFKLAKTIYTFDKEGKYYALVSLKRGPTIENSDINSTESSGKKVLIHFNMKGAKKWAELTKNNIGKMVAFTIDDQIYSLPKIMAEIRTGEALINGLESEKIARTLSESINSSIAN